MPLVISRPSLVIPAKAGIQGALDPRLRGDDAPPPAFAGMTFPSRMTAPAAFAGMTVFIYRAIILAPGAANSGGYTTFHVPFCTCLIFIRSSP